MVGAVVVDRRWAKPYTPPVAAFGRRAAYSGDLWAWPSFRSRFFIFFFRFPVRVFSIFFFFFRSLF
jgi:hypothetical protein